MSDHRAAAIVRTAGRAAVRLTLLQSGRTGVRVGAWVLIAALAASVASAILPLDSVPVLVAVAAAVGAGLLCAAAVAVFRPVHFLTAGQLLDLHGHLEERTSTALEVALSPTAPSRLGLRVIVDAIDRLEGVDLRQAFPWRVPREGWWIPGLVILLMIWGAWFRGLVLPGTPAHHTRQAIGQEGRRVEQFARALQSRSRTARMPQTRRIAPQMRDLGVRLQRDRVDRAEALARIAELSRQIEAARLEINERTKAVQPARTRDASVPVDLLRRQALQRQIRQLQELTSRLRHDPSAAARDALEGLAAMSESDGGNQPARVQRQLQRGREQLEQGDIAGASESLQNALRELESLESLLADEEGLQRAHQQLQRSGANIAAGALTPDGERAEESSPQQARARGAPGENPISPESGPEASSPPEGPHEGTTAGVGRVAEKLGAPSPRLQAQKSPQRVRGAQAEGQASVSEVVGAGRPGTAQVRISSVTPAIVAQVDRAMERARIPGRYRALVRRYFERLAHLR